MERHFTHRKTKIVCTIGPASNTEDMIRQMQKEGMDIARLNFSHGAHEDHKKILDIIHKINKDLDTPIGIMLDTKGPEIRTGKFKEPVTLKDNSNITITTKEIEWCNEEIIQVSYKNLPKIIRPGSFIYIADGTVELKVESIEGDDVLCTVNIGGEVGTRKNVNVPGAIVDLPALSEQDMSDIVFGIENKIDFIAQSFVKTAQDVDLTRKLLAMHNAEHISIISKIEAFQAIENLDSIIDVSDGIMVARGDLGVQIPIENIPSVQKNIIHKCNSKAKPVITATQMLESMTKNPRPTRAEATDVANAILDGTDAVMLSGETASGNHPLRAIETMNKIARKTEHTLRSIKQVHDEADSKHTIEDSISKSICHTAIDLGAAAIISCTSLGHTPKQISRHRPIVPIIAATHNENEYRKLVLVWGVIPMLIPYPKTTDELIRSALSVSREKGLVHTLDLVIIAASIPFNIAGNINMMKVEFID